MEFVSLSSIVTDLLLIIRGSKISSSEKISKRQIENWIHQYRSLLLRQNISNGDTINPDYVQPIPSVELVPIDAAGNISKISTGITLYRTSNKIPKTVNMKRMSGITYVGTLNKKRIQLVPGHRIEFQLYKKFTPMDTIAYLENEYIYVFNPHGLRYITLRGVFENPVEAALYSNSTMNIEEYDSNSKYPIPMDILPALKQLILEREIGIEAVAPGDLKNDRSPKITE